MLTATYTLVSLSVEQASLCASLRSLQKVLHTHFAELHSLSEGRVDFACDTLARAVHARRATTGRAATTPIALPTTAAPAATDQRPAPSLASYDQLLTSSGRQLEEAIA